MGLKPTHFLKKRVPHLGVAHVFYCIVIFSSRFSNTHYNSHMIVYQLFTTNLSQF